MLDWRTTTKRYVPKWKTHPKEWRMGDNRIVEVCALCQHHIGRHFHELEISFCLDCVK